MEKDEHTEIECAKRWEFSKRLTFFFLIVFMVHLLALLFSAIFSFGDSQLIKDSFTGSLPFYAVIFTGYTAKATFENYDKFKKQYEAKEKDDCSSLG